MAATPSPRAAFPAARPEARLAGPGGPADFRPEQRAGIEASLAGHDVLARGIRPGLERIEALLECLGRPQDRLKVVHVAGTNGKGSVCALLASVLREAGYRVGRYSSPHLVSYVERCWVDGAFISPPELQAHLAEAAAVRLDPELGPVTEFELLTAASLFYFDRQQLDVLVLEVGLGGRLDATNVFAAPEACAITRIAFDHLDFLGTSLTGIAREKAGILKPGVPAVVGAGPEALEAILEVAERLKAPVTLPPDARRVEGGVEIAGTLYPLGLPGGYQARNAAIAHATIGLLRQRGWIIPEQALVRGFADAHWSGRFQAWQGPDGTRYLFDGAHNPDGVEALAEQLEAEPQPRVMVLGMLRDKPTTEMLARLAPLAQTLVLTTAPSPRAATPDELARGLDHPDRHLVPEPGEALEVARRLSRGRSVIVAGSLYLVGAALARLGVPVRP